MFINNGMGGNVVVLTWVFLFGLNITTSGAVNEVVNIGQYILLSERFSGYHENGNDNVSDIKQPLYSIMLMFFC